MKKFLTALAYCLWVGVLFIGLQYIATFIALAIFGRETLSRPVIMATFEIFLYGLTLAVIILIPKLIEKRAKKAKDTITRISLGLHGMPTWTDIGLSIVGFVVYLVIAAILLTIVSSIFPWFNAEETQDLGFPFVLYDLEKIMVMLAIVVVAPICEEILFRGFLYERIKQLFVKKLDGKFKEEIPAIIIASLLTSITFGILHGQWNVGVNVFALSLVLCAQREITGTIYAGILLHMIKNALAFYMVFVLGVIH